MKPNGHHIRRHVLDLHFRSAGADGPRLRAAASRWQREVWIPMLERVLDDVAPTDETISIDRLEVDLEGISPAQWHEGAEHLAMERLREAVRKRLQGVVEHTGPAERRPLEAIAYYLRMGTLPWWSPVEITTNGPGAWLSEWIMNTSSSALAAEVPTIMNCTAARTRLAAELSEPVFWRLVRATSGDRDSSLWKREYIRCTAMLQDAGVPCDSFCISCRAAVLAAAMRMPDERNIAQDFVDELSALLDPKSRNVLNLHLAELRDKEQQQGHSDGSRESSTDAAIETVVGADALMLQDWPTLDAIRNDESIHTHYIGGAGAVLLAPFLPAFFGSVGLTLENTLTDPARAVVQLQYLITGQDTYGEWSLLLPKILCGLTPDALVPSGAIVLRKDEKDEADALLRAIIKHWTVLQSTSPEGLRQSFFQRDGRLTEKEEGWRLFVQPAAHDVLLQHLPWSIGVIKLPWMKAPVFVDWE